MEESTREPVRDQIDRICEEFEELWKQGLVPNIADQLQKIELVHHAQLIAALLPLDREYRSMHNLPCDAKFYRAILPEFAEQIEEVLFPPTKSGGPAQEERTKLPKQELVEIASFDSSSISKQIGPYKLLQQIGEGGMGTVWMAEQEKPVRRRVALKLIKSDATSKEIIARFEAERQALAMMDHQNIAKVLDAGTTEFGEPYFVMELVKGVPITQFCDDNRLSINERLELFVPICKAVQHAHQKGIIHRDLKPSNVLVTLYDGEAIPKVIDFGLAKAIEHTLKLTDKTMFTEFGKIVGTLQYMSPEQAEMNQLDVDTRTDIYSLGVMLYELLTGSTPLEKETLGEKALLQVLAIIREKEPPRPSTRLSDSGDAVTGISRQRKIAPAKLQQILRGDLDWVVMKALEKDRRRRYETANDFAQDINDYLSGDTVQARPPSTVYQLQKFARKNKGLVASILAIAAVLLAATGVSGWFAFKANIAVADALAQKKFAEEQKEAADIEKKNVEAEKKIAEAEREAADAAEIEAIKAEKVAQLAKMLAAKNEDLAKKAELKARESEVAAKFQLAVARWEANRPREARNLLHQIPIKYRNNFEWHYCNRHFLGSNFTCYGHRAGVESVCFSPDGTRIVSGSVDATLKLWDSTTGSEIKTLRGHSHGVNTVCFSPDGTKIASSSWDKSIILWDAKLGELIATLKGHADQVLHVCFSSDGSKIASGSSDKMIKLWDANTGAEIATFKGHDSHVGVVCFSPDGKQIVSQGAWEDKPIKLWDVATGLEIASYDRHSDSHGFDLSFSPDGSRIVSAGADNTIKIWDVKTGAVTTTLKGHIDMVECASFSPDGGRIASGSRDNTIKIWDAKTGSETITFKGHVHHVNCVCFSPDGARVASASGGEDRTIKVWDVTTGSETTTLRGHNKDVYRACFSDDGVRLASVSLDGTIRIWDAKTGIELSAIKGSSSDVNSVCFTPSGARIAARIASFGGEGDEIKVWDGETGEVIAECSGHARQLKCISFSPDGKYIASGSFDSKSIRVLHAETCSEVTIFNGHSAKLSGLCFSPDGNRIASVSADQVIKIWDVKSGTEVISFKGGSSPLRYSPDGERLISGRGSTIMLFDANTGDAIVKLIGHENVVHSLCFSPDGERIASGSRDKTIKLWDAETGDELVTLNGHNDTVNSVFFRPDGKQIVSASDDSTIKLWDAPTDSESLFLKGHTDFVIGSGFGSKDGHVYSKSWSEPLVWDLKTRQPTKTWKSILPRRIQPVSPDGRWFATFEGWNVILVDLEYRDLPREITYREAKARFDPWWHREQSKEAEKNGNWYAAAFYHAWLVKADKKNGSASVKPLRNAYEKLKGEFEQREVKLDPILPPVVKEMLKQMQTKEEIPDPSG